MTTASDTQLERFQRATGRQVAIVWLVAAAIVGLSLAVHLAAPSSIHRSEQEWADKVAFHHTLLPFHVRPLTNGVLDFGHDGLGLSYRTTFFTLQFILYLCCCPVFWYYLRSLRFNHAYSLSGMIVFGLTLPLFLAHFEPIQTWSDFWVYLGLPLALATLIRRHYVISMLAMLLALIARETSLLFVPVWFVFMFVGNRRTWQKSAILALLPVAAAAGLRWLMTPAITVIPTWDFDFNFAGRLRASDAVFSTLVSLGFVWVVGLTQAFRRSRANVWNYDLVRLAALFTAAGTLVSTLLLTYARETRLFVPPIVFLLPLVLVYIQDRKDEIARLWRRVPVPMTILAAAVLCAGCIGLVKLVFPVFEYRHWHDGNWTYLGLHLALVVVFFLVEYSSRGRSVAIQPGKN